MISIIIPAYNCEKYISTCIDSILRQNESSIEVIIIDDGSKDATGRIIDSYIELDNRIRVFHVENGGPSKARNIALDKATGDWILFVDADDWVDPNIISELNLNPGSADIIFFGFKRCYEQATYEICIPTATNCIKNKDQIYSQLKDLLNNKNEFFGYSVNKIYKHSIIKTHNIRFRESLNIREDETFTLNYCQYIHSIQTIAFAPYNYRILNESLSHNTQVHYRNYKLLISAERVLLDLYPPNDFKFSFISRIFSYYISSIIECINMNLSDKYEIIDEAIMFYDANKQKIISPKWQSLIFGFPLRHIRRYIINFIFSIRKSLFKQ